jgi:glycosyltransferase involved in cell wall biosynthesis
MKRRIGILSIINDLPHGGDEHRLLSFATHVDREKFDHHVAVIKAREPDFEAENGTMRPDFVARGVPLIELGQERRWKNKGIDVMGGLPNRTVGFGRAIRELVRSVRAFDIDVIDGHVGTGNQAAVAVGKLTGRPVALTTYHAEFFTPRWLWYPVQQATLRGADVIVTDSRQRADTMRRFLRSPRAPITIIPNGISIEPARRSREEVAAEIGVPSDAKIVIGQIAGMIPTKGWAVLVEAAALVLALEPRAFFLCIGHQRHDPAFPTMMRDKAAALGIADRMRFLGYHGNNADVWQLFDVHVHASLFDSLPNAIIEGMAHAKPAVVTDVGDCARIVENDVSGLVVPPGDARRLADALLRLIAEPALRARFGAEARRRYETGHRPEVMTGALQALFERLVAR